jgi:glycerol uptake facilitator-like aquaporin
MKDLQQLVTKNYRALTAEAVGTMLLAIAVFASLLTGLPAFLVAPIALMFIVFAIGSVSGGHVNPAITVGAWFSGAISWKRAVGYIIAQFIGAGLVLLVISLLPSLRASGMLSAIMGQMGTPNLVTSAIAEVVALVIFGFGVGSVVFGKLSDSVKPVVVGMSLMMALFVTVLLGGAVANPAVSLALGGFAISKLLAPLVGSVIGFGLARFIHVR